MPRRKSPSLMIEDWRCTWTFQEPEVEFEPEFVMKMAWAFGSGIQDDILKIKEDVFPSFVICPYCCGHSDLTASHLQAPSHWPPSARPLLLSCLFCRWKTPGSVTGKEMASSPSWCAREVGKLHYPELKVDINRSPTVTLDYTFALSLSVESSLQAYLSRAFARGHNREQAKYGAGGSK